MGWNAQAAWCLKEMYEEGLGVPRNRKESRCWGMLFESIDNAARASYLYQVLTTTGDLEMPMWDELVRPARGDDWRKWPEAPVSPSHLR